MPVSACVFVRDAFRGGFTIFESMASMLPLVDEFVVLDLGSGDGTLERLERIAERNRKVRLLRGRFPTVDAGAFATLANDLIDECRYDAVWYCQADEVPHQDLLKLLKPRLDAGEYDWTFWRIQLGYNFQEPRWLPHLVHRIGPKNNFHFVGDGMNTERVWGVNVCSSRNAGWFTKWGELYDKEGPDSLKPWIKEMILDISLLGAFRDIIPQRRRLHAPFWHEEPVIPYRLPGEKQDRQYKESDWVRIANADDRWRRTESPYDIPAILKWHISRPTYDLRADLFEDLCKGDTGRWIGL